MFQHIEETDKVLFKSKYKGSFYFLELWNALDNNDPFLNISIVQPYWKNDYGIFTLLIFRLTPYKNVFKFNVHILITGSCKLHCLTIAKVNNTFFFVFC